MDAMTALAMTGATTIVAAMATNAWQGARAGAARLFHRRGHALAAIEAQLDGDAAIVQQDADADGARQDLVGPWTRRLAALLREHPEAEADLRALLAEVRTQLPDAQRGWVQTNLARDGGQTVVEEGSVGAPRRQSRPGGRGIPRREGARRGDTPRGPP